MHFQIDNILERGIQELPHSNLQLPQIAIVLHSKFIYNLYKVCLSILISLQFQNDGKFVDIFRSNGQTSSPNLRNLGSLDIIMKLNNF